MEGPAWLRDTRHAAFERFRQADLPTDAEEVWRYSRINDLDLDRYEAITSPASLASESRGSQLSALPAELAAAVSVRSGLVSTYQGVLTDVALTHPSLSLSVPDEDGEVFGRIAGEPDALVMLNTALAISPLELIVAKGAVIEHPVVIVHAVAPGAKAVFPRVLIRMEPGAEVHVLEVMVSTLPPTASSQAAAASAAGDGSGSGSLVVPVTEMDVADTAHLHYLNLQILSGQSWQLGTQASRVGRDATLNSCSVAFGGHYARIRTDSAVVGRGASSSLRAAYFGQDDQMHDFRTLQDHRAPKTTSDLLFKGAVANRSRSVYSGLIRVEKGAAGTHAYQANRNLVLHEGAHADSVPNLEIEENDVRCTHASAVGPIDEDQRFYLESRGVPGDVAERLIVLGFLDEVMSQVPVKSVAPWLRAKLAIELARAESTAEQSEASGRGQQENLVEL